MTSLQGGMRSSRRHMTMSGSVRHLQDAINLHLDMSEKGEFVDILNDFHVNRDMKKFLRNLKLLLDTPAKSQLFALIKKVIPAAEMEQFDHFLMGKGKKYNTVPVRQPKNQRSRPPLTTSRIDSKAAKKQKKQKHGKGKDENESESSKNTNVGNSIDTSKHSSSSVQNRENDIKHIEICQSAGNTGGFGFSIRGGVEYGIGIYVSMVDKAGLADRMGLMPGDLLMEVNQVLFNNITHNDAAKVIQSSNKLDIVISRVGRIPGSFTIHQKYKWVDGSGCTVSPPPELQQLGKLDSVGRRSGFALLTAPDERKINISVGSRQSLGVMIRGGREFGLGIYVSGVDPHTLAEQAGIKVGDQILDVNGRSFLDITHSEAVQVLKTSKYLMLTIKDVGKLPYARTKIDKTCWMRRSEQRKNIQRTESLSTDNSIAQNGMFRKGIGSQLMYNTAISRKWDIIENKSLQLLNDMEQGTLRYYLSEYESGFISVDGLAMASFELLNTQAKMSLMKEIRSWVQDRDLNKFDMLLMRRQAKQREDLRVQYEPGTIPPSYSTYSLDRHGHVLSNRLHNTYRAMSAPSSRAATVREKSSRVHRAVVDWELEPLRQAIEQIDDHIQSDKHLKPSRKSALQRSKSTDFIHPPSPNLLKTSLSSGRSMSEETLIPVYIDTTSDLTPSHKSFKHSAPRSRSSSATKRHRPSNSYTHRQRSGSNSSSLRRRYRSVEDIRLASPGDLPTQSYNYLLSDREMSGPSHIYTVEADIHQRPSSSIQPADGSPSDDSGVDSGGHTDHLGNRVTISSDNPVNINDVLHNRSFVKQLSQDDSIHSNHSTITLQSASSYQSNATLTSQRKGHALSATSSPNFSTSRRNVMVQPPVEIKINDGTGSIDSLFVESLSSPRFVNQSQAGRTHDKLRFQKSSMFETDDDEDEDNDDEDDDKHDSLEISSDIGDSRNPFEKILNNTFSQKEAIQIKDAKKKYGEIPLYIIPVYKTKPTLGMAIEGGANTRQPVPRVISLQPGGSAYESGGLKVGHMILEVNGCSVIGLEHINAAKTLAEAFKNNGQDYMELLVTDSDVKVNLHTY